MAGLIEAAYTSGQTVYALVRNSAGSVWNGSGFVTFSAASWSTYAIPLTEEGTTGYYKIAFPTGISTAGKYTIVTYNQSGGSPAVGDAANGPIGIGSIYWTGTAEQAQFVAVVAAAATPSDTDSYAYYQARLSQLDLKISAIIDNPRPNYKVGSVTYNHGDLLKLLMEIREKTLQRMIDKPSESFETVQNDIDAFGKDFTTYLNSPLSQDLFYPIR